jgi:hypothetical protein
MGTLAILLLGAIISYFLLRFVHKNTIDGPAYDVKHRVIYILLSLLLSWFCVAVCAGVILIFGEWGQKKVKW